MAHSLERMENKIRKNHGDKMHLTSLNDDNQIINLEIRKVRLDHSLRPKIEDGENISGAFKFQKFH